MGGTRAGGEGERGREKVRGGPNRRSGALTGAVATGRRIKGGAGLMTPCHRSASPHPPVSLGSLVFPGCLVLVGRPAFGLGRACLWQPLFCCCLGAYRSCCRRAHPLD